MEKTNIDCADSIEAPALWLGAPQKSPRRARERLFWAAAWRKSAMGISQIRSALLPAPLWFAFGGAAISCNSEPFPRAGERRRRQLACRRHSSLFGAARRIGAAPGERASLSLAGRKAPPLARDDSLQTILRPARRFFFPCLRRVAGAASADHDDDDSNNSGGCSNDNNDRRPKQSACPKVNTLGLGFTSELTGARNVRHETSRAEPSRAAEPEPNKRRSAGRAGGSRFDRSRSCRESLNPRLTSRVQRPRRIKRRPSDGSRR